MTTLILLSVQELESKMTSSGSHKRTTGSANGVNGDNIQSSKNHTRRKSSTDSTSVDNKNLKNQSNTTSNSNSVSIAGNSFKSIDEILEYLAKYNVKEYDQEQLLAYIKVLYEVHSVLRSHYIHLEDPKSPIPLTMYNSSEKLSSIVQSFLAIAKGTLETEEFTEHHQTLKACEMELGFFTGAVHTLKLANHSDQTVIEHLSKAEHVRRIASSDIITHTLIDLDSVTFLKKLRAEIDTSRFYLLKAEQLFYTLLISDFDALFEKLSRCRRAIAQYMVMQLGQALLRLPKLKDRPVSHQLISIWNRNAIRVLQRKHVENIERDFISNSVTLDLSLSDQSSVNRGRRMRQRDMFTMPYAYPTVSSDTTYASSSNLPTVHPAVRLIQINRDPYTPISASRAKSITESIFVMFNRSKPSDDEVRNRNQLFLELKTNVHRVLPGFTIEMFGSSKIKMYTKESDMDVCLLAANNDSALLTVHQLEKLKRQLDKRFVHVLPIFSARVPILKMEDSITGISVDISLVRTDLQFKNALIEKYVEHDPRMFQLVHSIKSWARNRDLSVAAHGGLNSFGWTLLVIQFLQMSVPFILPNYQENIASEIGVSKPNLTENNTNHSESKSDDTTPASALEPNSYFGTKFHPIAPNLSQLTKVKDKYSFTESPTVSKETNNTSVGELLYQFFHFYSNVFQFQTMAVSILHGHTINAQQWRTFNTRHQEIDILILDPFDIMDNVARSVRPANSQRIYDELKRAYRLLQDNTSLEIVFEAANSNSGSLENSRMDRKVLVK